MNYISLQYNVLQQNHGCESVFKLSYCSPLLHPMLVDLIVNTPNCDLFRRLFIQPVFGKTLSIVGTFHSKKKSNAKLNIGPCSLNSPLLTQQSFGSNSEKGNSKQSIVFLTPYNQFSFDKAFANNYTKMCFVYGRPRLNTKLMSIDLSQSNTTHCQTV